MLTPLIKKLTQHKALTAEESSSAATYLSQHYDESLASEFLTLMQQKGETSDEIYGFVKALRCEMLTVATSMPTLDIVGTGGDNANTINISSASSLIVASLGVTVAKHGNRSVSSQCGSADFFEAMGIPIELTAEKIDTELQQKNFAFLYAPLFYPSLMKFKELRRRLKTRTIFNLLGPLLNPSNPEYYLLGVYDPKLLDEFADILRRFNTKKALIVHSCGLDEISLLGPTKIVEIDQQQKTHYEITPNDFHLATCQLAEIQGGNAELNKRLILQALSGKQSAILNTLLMNSGAALYAAEQCESISAGVKLAEAQIQAGKVIDYLKVNFNA